MKDSTMNWWEEGVSEWNYYKFTGNTPYSAPFHFKVTTSSGQEFIGYDVIRSITAGDSGQISLASAYTSDDEDRIMTDNIPGYEVVAMVICSVFVCCVVGMMCYVHHRRKKRVITMGVENENVINQEDGGYDMSPITSDSIQKTHDGQVNETETMIAVQISATKQ